MYEKKKKKKGIGLSKVKIHTGRVKMPSTEVATAG